MLAVASSSFGQDSDPFAVLDLRCEDLVDPLGVDIAQPRLSWKMQSDANGAAQTAYQIFCATEPEFLPSSSTEFERQPKGALRKASHEGSADLWDSGKVTSVHSQHIIYSGKERSRNLPCYWTVRVWNESGDVSAWSKPGLWTFTDLESNKDWSAKWITDTTSSPWLRKSMTLDAVPARAIIHINALGYFQLYINGKRVGVDEFAPHVGQYDKRTFSITYDVTEHLQAGKNSIGFWMGSGWNRAGAGVKVAPSVRAQLEMVDDTGRPVSLITDESWRAKASSMAYQGSWKWSKYGGEVHTGRLDEPDWANADFDDRAWSQAKLADIPDTPVSAEMLQRNRVVETIPAVKVTRLSQGVHPSNDAVVNHEPIKVRIKKALYGVPGNPKQQVDLRNALQTLVDSNKHCFKVTNIWAGKDPAFKIEKVLVLEYDLNGKTITQNIPENEDYSFATVGAPANASTSGAAWLVDMGKAMTGTFEITFPKAEKGRKVSMEFSDSYSPAKKRGFPKMNRLGQASEYICRGSGIEMFKNRFNYASCRYILIRNAPQGDMVSEDIKGSFITTDLPKASTFDCSDETLNGIYLMMDHTLRCLMLGGYQVDCHSRERFGYGGDGHSSLDTTLSFLRSDAFYRKWTRDWLDGQKDDGGFTYTTPASGHGGGPFWCGFLTAGTLKYYHHYGDLSVVQRNYPAIKKWFELAQSKTVNDLQEQFCGSWYLGDWASPQGIDDKGNAEVFIHAYMAYALEQGAQLADALGEKGDARMFREWATARNVATHKKFYDPQANKYGTGDQVAYVVPLIAGVVPDDLQDKVFAGFEETLLVKDKGHLSTGLSGTYLMIQYLQSIGRDDLIYTFASKKTYPSWGYMIENGATATWEHWNGDESRIHNCYNNIGSWFIQGLAGIRPDPENPGFQNAIIKPAFLKELSYVKGSHNSAYGRIESNWKREGDRVTMEIAIPANSTATVYVPAAVLGDITVNGQALSKADHVTLVSMEKNRAVVTIRSGKYIIKTDIKKI